MPALFRYLVFGTFAGGGVVRALLGDGALYAQYVTAQEFAAGDTATFWIANTFDNTGGGQALKVTDGVDATARMLIRQASDGTILFNTAVMTLTIDGVAVVNGVTVFPIDGLLKPWKVTAIATCYLATLYAAFIPQDFTFNALSRIVADTVARGTESWVFGGPSTTIVLERLGTGSSINLVGVSAGNFVELPLP